MSYGCDANLQQKKINSCKVNYITYTSITQNTHLQYFKLQQHPDIKNHSLEKRDQLIFHVLFLSHFLPIIRIR